MKRIECLRDLNSIEGEFSIEFLEYIKCEFYDIYNYLNNGENIENFKLPFYQNMLLLDTNEDVCTILNQTMDIEFVEEIEQKGITIIRIGLNCGEDVQLSYAIKNECIDD